MKQKLLFFSLLIIMGLAACRPATEIIVSPTHTSTPLATHTSAPTATVAPPTPTLPETAVATVTIEPTTAISTSASDPYTLARELLEQTNLPEFEEWQITLCAGETAVLCIGDGAQTIGFAELLLYPLNSYDPDHPVPLAASQLPITPTMYTAEEKSAINQALTALVQEHLDVIQADRAITFPDDTFTPLAAEPTQMGALSATAFGFSRTNAAGELQERYLNIAAFDAQYIYWFNINYDPANVSTFVSDTAVSQFIPIFYDLATRLPIHQSILSALPEFVPAISLSGDFPSEISWSLATELPDAETAVAVLSQPAQIEPLTIEEAMLTAQKYGFATPLYVEYRTGFSLEELIDYGMFIAFDGPRNLTLWGSPYFYNDTTHQPPAFDLPFAQAAPIAEKFLEENGWLTFPYELAESDQGEGVLFLPIIDGIQLTSPAYGVRVAADSGIPSMFIYPQDSLRTVGHYPILTAATAWEQIMTDPNQSGIFYQIDPPPMETAVSFPPTYNRLPAPGESGTVYNNIWVYRPVSGDGPPIITSNNYFRITGDPAMLEELAAETDYLVKLTGTVQEPSPGLQSLELTEWELVPDAGGLPLFYGQIAYESGQAFLVDAANSMTYLLPDAPADLQTDVETAVAGLPEMVDGVQTLNWQKITTFRSAAETILPRPTTPMQAITIDSAKLVYLRMPAHFSGLTDHLFFPVWQFSGTADNGEQVTMWVTAIIQ